MIHPPAPLWDWDMLEPHPAESPPIHVILDARTLRLLVRQTALRNPAAARVIQQQLNELTRDGRPFIANLGLASARARAIANWLQCSDSMAAILAQRHAIAMRDGVNLMEDI